MERRVAPPPFRLDVFNQAVLILPHLEEVVVLAELFNGALAVRTESGLHVLLSPEPLIERAIPARVVGLPPVPTVS